METSLPNNGGQKAFDRVWNRGLVYQEPEWHTPNTNYNRWWSKAVYRSSRKGHCAKRLLHITDNPKWWEYSSSKCSKRVARELKHIELNLTEVKSVLKKLNPNKAMGPDTVNPCVLKECANQLAGPLSRIFNMSLQQGIYPALWKDAIITAIFKKGDRKQPSNYRPISILSCLGKVMEKCVFIRLYTYLTDLKANNSIPIWFYFRRLNS